jgi:flagellar M-ring protein FliF
MAVLPGGGQLALPQSEVEQRLDVARVEGQVKASSIKKVAEFVDGHPDEASAILRSWVHEG